MSTSSSTTSSPPPGPRTPNNAYVKQTITITADGLAALGLLAHEHGHAAVLDPDGDDQNTALAVEGKFEKYDNNGICDVPLDPLLIAATAASGPHATRHHYHHHFTPAAATNDGDPLWDWTRWMQGADSDSEDSSAGNHGIGLGAAAAGLHDGARYVSRQAPRSQRLRALRDQLDTGSGTRSPSLSPCLSSTPSLVSSEPESEDEKLLSLPAPTNGLRGLSLTLNAEPGAVAAAVAAAAPAKPTLEVQVRCMVRTRIPTPHGEVFLHLYHNDRDSKEHLAIVVDPAQLAVSDDNDGTVHAPFIRSRSLDAVWEGESTMDRITRGAYVGRLSEASCVPSAPLEEGGNIVGVNGEVSVNVPPPLVRIHSECFTGETIGSLRCDCGEQLDEAIRRIAQPMTISIPTPSSNNRNVSSGTATNAGAFSQQSTTTVTIPGRGAVVYMRQEGRGIGLLSKLRAYNLQDLGHDTVAANLLLGHGADERGYEVAAAILNDLGLGESSWRERKEGAGVRLLTNNPDKVQALARAGVCVAERVPMVPRSWRCQAESRASHTKGELATEPTDDDGVEREEREARLRAAGATLLGASATQSPELEKYLRTKILKMGHMVSLPASDGVAASA